MASGSKKSDFNLDRKKTRQFTHILQQKTNPNYRAARLEYFQKSNEKSASIKSKAEGFLSSRSKKNNSKKIQKFTPSKFTLNTTRNRTYRTLGTKQRIEKILRSSNYGKGRGGEVMDSEARKLARKHKI